MQTSRTTRRLLRAAAPLGIAVLALSACSDGGSGGGTQNSNIAAVIKGLDNPFFQAMQDGIETTASEAGVQATVQAAADINDETGQADRLQTLAGQDFGCYIVNPISANNLIQALAPISQAGKTIVSIDQPLDDTAVEAAGIDIATYIGTDNVAAGEKAGAFMAENVEAGSTVAVIGGIAGNVTSGDRIDGFLSAIDGLTALPTQAGDWSRERALTLATDIIAANPDVKGFFAANDDMGLGIVRAVENAGLAGEITVVSVDGNMDALESVQNGGLSATVAQYPFAIGALGVDACRAAASGAELPANVESPTQLVTASEAEDAIAAFPQPFASFDNPLADLVD